MEKQVDGCYVHAMRDDYLHLHDNFWRFCISESRAWCLNSGKLINPFLFSGEAELFIAGQTTLRPLENIPMLPTGCLCVLTIFCFLTTHSFSSFHFRYFTIHWVIGDFNLEFCSKQTKVMLTFSVSRQNALSLSLKCNNVIFSITFPKSTFFACCLLFCLCWCINTLIFALPKPTVYQWNSVRKAKISAGNLTIYWRINYLINKIFVRKKLNWQGI